MTMHALIKPLFRAWHSKFSNNRAFDECDAMEEIFVHGVWCLYDKIKVFA